MFYFFFPTIPCKEMTPQFRKNAISHIWQFYTTFTLQFCSKILIYIQKVKKYEKRQRSVSKTCFIFSVEGLVVKI